MSTKTDSLSQSVDFKIQNPSIDHPSSPRIKDDINFRIRSLLISRNNRYPPRTPRSSIECLRRYANSDKINLLRSGAEIPFSISKTSDKSSGGYSISRNNSNKRELEALGILDAPQASIGDVYLTNRNEKLSDFMPLNKTILQRQEKRKPIDNEINGDIGSYSTKTSTDENYSQPLQRKSWGLYNSQLTKSSLVSPRSTSPELLVSPCDLSCFVEGCSPGLCKFESHRSNSTWSAVREDAKFRTIRCNEKSVSEDITNKFESVSKVLGISSSIDLINSRKMSKINDHTSEGLLINEKSKSIIQTATSSGTSGSIDSFPHALRSSKISIKEIQGPTYSTTLSTNFSLAAAKNKNNVLKSLRKETSNFQPELKLSISSSTSRNRILQNEPSDKSIISKPKTPSLISVGSKKLPRHGLLKASITDTRPVDVGLAISPLLTYGETYPNDFHMETVYDKSRRLIPENEKILQSNENYFSSFPSSTAKLKRLRKFNSDSSAFIVKSLSKHSLNFVDPQTVDATSPHSLKDMRISDNSQPLIDDKLSEKNKEEAMDTHLEKVTENRREVARSLDTNLKSDFRINAETKPFSLETVWWKQDLWQQNSMENNNPLLFQSNFLNSRDKETDFCQSLNLKECSSYTCQNKKSGISNTSSGSEKLELCSKMGKTTQKKNSRSKTDSNKYTPIPNEELSGANIYNTTSHGSNPPQKNLVPENEMELNSIPSAKLFRSFESTNINHRLVNPKHSDPPGNQESDSTYKNTVNWLRNLITSNDQLESRLTALPSRTVRQRGLRKYAISNTNDVDGKWCDIDPKPSKQDPDFEKDLLLNAGQKQRIDVSEAFANTISELEILMTEALSMARQATDRHSPTQILSESENSTTVKYNDQAHENSSTNKLLNTDNLHEDIQECLEEKETCNGGSEHIPSAIVEKKNLKKIFKSTLDQQKIKSSQPSSEPVSTPYPLRYQKLSENGFEETKFTYPRKFPTQKCHELAKQPESNSVKSIITPKNDSVIKFDNLKSLDLQTSAQDLTCQVNKSSVKSEPHSASTILLVDQNLKKGALHERNTAKSSQPGNLYKINVSRCDLNDHCKQDDKTKSNSQSSMNFAGLSSKKIKPKNQFRAKDPVEINRGYNHNLEGSEITYNDVVDFNSGFNLGKDIELSNGKTRGPPLLSRSNHKKEYSLSGKTHISLKEHDLKEFSLVKSHKRRPIARDWSPGRKRLVASVACISTSLIGILVGIYAGETPAIQYYIADFHHFTVLGNVLFFFGLAIPTFFAWPLPLLHGRKPYILGSMSLAMPLLFPQALAVGEFRSPYVSIWRVCLLLPRALMGLCLGFANMNFKCVLTDLFGASLQSTNPHQEHADEFDVRRHGGGMGAWLGLWTWCALGSIGIGFLIGANVIEKLSPSWGFYFSIIIIAFVMLLNVVCPEVRRSAYRRSVAQFVTKDVISHRLARGEVKMHMVKIGPKWWGEELQYGIRLSQNMLRQPGFLIMSLYVAWIYGQQVLITVLLGALLSDDYKFRSTLVGVSATAIPLGALVAIPFQKASFFSRSRRNPPLDDDGTLSKKKLHWSSHMLRRAIFVLFLPLFGLFVTITAGGPPIPFILPILGAGVIGFLSSLAMAECHGIVMETFDTSDLEPGLTGRSRGSSSKIRGKPINYSSFPRVSSAFAIIETFGYVFAAGTSGISGVISRRLGRQAAIGLMTGVLVILSVLLLGILVRFTEVQIIPDSKIDDMNQYQARRASASRGLAGNIPDDQEPWRPIIIGNPHQSTRRMCVLELGSMSRFSEIRKKNKLIDQMSLEAKYPNRNAIDSLEHRIKEMEKEFIHNFRRSVSITSRDSRRSEEPGISKSDGRKKLRRSEIEGNTTHVGNIRRKLVRERNILE